MYRYSDKWNQPKHAKTDGLTDDRSRLYCGGRPQCSSEKPKQLAVVRRYGGPSRYKKLMRTFESEEPYIPVPIGRHLSPRRNRLFQRVSNKTFTSEVLACVQDPDKARRPSLLLLKRGKWDLLVRLTDRSVPLDHSVTKVVCADCDYPYNSEKRRKPHHLANLVPVKLPRGWWNARPAELKIPPALEPRVALAIAPASKRVIQKLGARRSSTELYKHIIRLDK